MPARKDFYRRNLPHWQPSGADFFVTFRLHGSLPKDVLRALQQEKHRLELEAGNDLEALDLARKRMYGKFDAALDHATNEPYWLKQPAMARIVVEALEFQDGSSYILHAYTIMPNHVHVLFSHLQEGPELHRIMQRMKRHTAREGNILLDRTGAQFWERESYDRVVRDNREFWRIYWYILKNPEKAGLVEKWFQHPWTWGKYEP
ncbi:MAG: hypothetical protein EP344_06660 [Bacteroidetes bacterium]|nr:MAG: hypothetical protein EP344_06660 [Bacteroidota bacterium]